MTPEVKQRIEQIQQGIVPEGYKKTKTAIVPADWKESPIGKYIREYTEKTTIPNQYPVLTSARTGLMLQTDYYSNRQVTTEDNVGYNVLPYGYITFRSRSDDGRFRFNENRIIERGIISYFYPVFSFSEEVCHEYMLYLLNFSIYRRMYPYAEGTAQQVLSLKKLGQFKYSLPLVAEQKKIAEILSTQDKAIELQGRKIEELKRFKKGCLERMFPRKGQKVPEKRFPGFTDDWEQRKFSELVQIERGGSPRPIDDFITDAPNGLNWVKIGDAPTQGNYITKTAEKIRPEGLSKTREVHPGDLILSNSMSFGKPYIMGIDGCIHDGWLLIRNTYGVFDLTFLCHLLGTPQMLSQYRSLAAGSTVNNLNKELVGNTVVTIPSITEQRVLGDYLEQLDNLITLHQRKLDEMKKQKKALMQLLLTGIVRVRL